MTLINFIVILLAIIPIFGVITDVQKGKIRNVFIFPYFIFLGILGYFIEGFYQDINHLIEVGICLLLGFLFYIHNKWGAGDGKYIIILGFSTIIISYLKQVPLFITLFIYIFSIFFLYNIFYITKNITKIKRIKFAKQKIILFDIFYIISSLKIISYFLYPYLPQEYSYIIIFLFIIIVIPFLEKISNKYFKISIIFICLFLTFYYQLYMSLFFIGITFMIFKYVSNCINQIFDEIDIKQIKIIDIKQGDILTENSIKQIKSKINIELQESPLQGIDIYEIIKVYKEHNDINTVITIYKDIRIGIFLYIGFIINILSLLL